LLQKGEKNIDIEIGYLKKPDFVTSDFPILLSEHENLHMINFSMLQIPSFEKEDFIQLLFSLISPPLAMYMELNEDDEKDFENQLIQKNIDFIKKINTKNKCLFEIIIREPMDFKKIMDEFIYQICLGNQVFFSTDKSNLQFFEKNNVVGFSKSEVIYTDIKIKKDTSVLFIGNDANEMFLLTKKVGFANIKEVESLLPSFIQFTHRDFE